LRKAERAILAAEVDFTSAEAQEIIRQTQEFLQAAKDYLE
jgi:hypothetical protein